MKTSCFDTASRPANGSSSSNNWGRCDRARRTASFVREPKDNVEMRSSRTPEALEKLEAELEGLIDRIEAEREYAPHESALCDWCAYQDLCPAKKQKAEEKP